MHSKVKGHYKVKNEHKEIMGDYVQHLERLIRECKKVEGGALADEMKECYLLEQASSSESVQYPRGL